MQFNVNIYEYLSMSILEREVKETGVNFWVKLTSCFFVKTLFITKQIFLVPPFLFERSRLLTFNDKR
ncbi:CLUMA_CG007101, isoform A [Clunio marinus]|uniref:CLUMA_CG007101, isoform A n=1 Tax=Clunio marinus TaxID=568069 RepID=A0A1J1HZN6_9DIPT|nr:CLUMA_CG007101, isoform A [Clunio marinus]